MKKLILFFVLFVTTLHAQHDYSKVMDLLLQNKREEARNLFDKNFSKIKNTHPDLIFLDAMLDYSLGKIEFDETLVKNLEKQPNAVYYIDPFINNVFVMDDINDDGYNDLTLKKIDFLAQSSVFQNRNIVIYRKATSDRYRKKYSEANALFKKLNVIDQWQYCGVFENLNGSGLDTEYEPETYAKNDKTFNANSNGIVNWYTPKKQQDDGYFFFLNEAEYGNGIIYAQSFVNVPETKQYLLKFGCSSAIKIFINDVEIATKEETGKTNLDAFNYKINLKKGINRILVKVEQGGEAYFSASLRNVDNSLISNINYSSNYIEYNKNTLDEINPIEISLDFEKYFEDLVAKNPNNILYKYFLFNAYLANEKKDKMEGLIKPLLEQYPNSTFIKILSSSYYQLEGENQKIEELIANIENQDKYYHEFLASKLLDSEWYGNLEISELEDYVKKTSTFKSNYYKMMFEFLLKIRKNDKEGMIVSLEDIVKERGNNHKLLILKETLKYKLNNNYDDYIKALLEIRKNYENIEIDDNLIEYYNKNNQKDKVAEILKHNTDIYYNFNAFRDNYIDELLKENKYDEAIKNIDENLQYFPYSFKNLESKGNVYRLMKNDKEAEKYYLQALKYDSGNSDIRKKIRDINKTEDEIDLVETKNIYDLIKKRRNSQLKTDYGVVILLDEYIVNVLDEGCTKSKVRIIYEVTSENGIENLKEYNLNSYGLNLIKSEIVKKNGSLIPAEESGSQLVFPNLEIGDVIYIEYEDINSSYGRFYKDINVDFSFNGSYPSVEAIFSIINKPNITYNIAQRNGNIIPTNKKLKDKNITTWKTTNIPAIAPHEKFAPEYSDVIHSIEISSIKSWKEIANWYADLVKKNLKFDAITEKTYNQIFPNGTTGLTETQRAEKIYAHICQNITYSFLDFRQSGYVPQKPSKTITTKLGDCKDLSTLFVTLADKAGLKANLVLVLTADNGKNSLPLPSQGFNHCIAKVNLEGKEYFLEMTDKYLPFKALPMSLYEANALVVDFDKTINEKANLIKIPFTNALPSKRQIKTEVTIYDDKKEFVNTHTVVGAKKSYVNELFSTATTEDVRKKDLEESFNKRLDKTVLNLKSSCSETNMFSPTSEYKTQFTIAEKNQKLGSLNVISVPFIDAPYTKDIVNFEKRNYDIEYSGYEDVNEYDSEIILNIAEGRKFIEIPEGKELKFGKHVYTIKYNLLKNNQLQIIRKVTIPFDNIKSTEFMNFKTFVDEVINLEEQIIGFK